MTSPRMEHAIQATNLADILERVLDKGIVIAGDITISLVGVELLNIKLRLLVASGMRFISTNSTVTCQPCSSLLRADTVSGLSPVSWASCSLARCAIFGAVVIVPPLTFHSLLPGALD